MGCRFLAHRFLDKLQHQSHPCLSEEALVVDPSEVASDLLAEVDPWVDRWQGVDPA